ncbi:putative Metal transporter cnnm-1 [Paratrimastix pyriformis]|uniref:Metal transporter cnnm-1 n=1 Tax=Paratrimastix pyriformis TaxID=342808 RepID=A0ABQ8UGC5_9EUKA|nr:putative Metal transporter cnnm-1 [Paratrimastix pyriformis]
MSEMLCGIQAPGEELCYPIEKDHMLKDRTRLEGAKFSASPRKKRDGKTKMWHGAVANCPKLNEVDPSSATDPLTFWLSIGAVCILVIISGLCSGISLGVLSLDQTYLEVLIAAGSDREKKQARRLKPIRKQGNLLLCAVVLTNVAVNSAISILMEEVGGGLMAFVVSTVLIMIFGEIFPQALFSRYGMTICAILTPLLWFMIVVLYVVIIPIVWLLNCLLGKDLGTFYSRVQLKKLLELHSTEGRTFINENEVRVLTGALDFSAKTVAGVMTPLAYVDMLDDASIFDFETRERVFETGHSRIPVYHGPRSNMIGFLVVKDLILLDPEARLSVAEIFHFFGRPALHVTTTQRLDEVLAEFKVARTEFSNDVDQNFKLFENFITQSGRHGHLALVDRVNGDDPARDPSYETVGVITLEDCLEALLQDEIIDESDQYVDAERRQQAVERGASHSARDVLRSRRHWVRAAPMSPELVSLLSCWLRRRLPDSFGPGLLTDPCLHALLSRAPLYVLDPLCLAQQKQHPHQQPAGSQQALVALTPPPPLAGPVINATTGGISTTTDTGMVATTGVPATITEVPSISTITGVPASMTEVPATMTGVPATMTGVPASTEPLVAVANPPVPCLTAPANTTTWLSPELCRHLAELPESFLMLQGEPAPECTVLLSGHVRLGMRDVAQGQTQTRLLGPGDILAPEVLRHLDPTATLAQATAQLCLLEGPPAGGEDAPVGTTTVAPTQAATGLPTSALASTAPTPVLSTIVPTSPIPLVFTPPASLLTLLGTDVDQTPEPSAGDSGLVASPALWCAATAAAEKPPPRHQRYQPRGAAASASLRSRRHRGSALEAADGGWSWRSEGDADD